MFTGRILVTSLFLLGSGCSSEPDDDQVASSASALQPVTWRNAVGVSAIDNDLTKSAPQILWNAGASSVESVDGDGYAEFTTGENIYEAGVERVGNAGSYAAGDHFRVLVVAGVVTYWHNGADGVRGDDFGDSVAFGGPDPVEALVTQADPSAVHVHDVSTCE